VFQYELGVFVGECDEVRAAQSDKNEPNKGRRHFDGVYSPVEPCANKSFGLDDKIDLVVSYLVIQGCNVTFKVLTNGQC